MRTLLALVLFVGCASEGTDTAAEETKTDETTADEATEVSLFITSEEHEIGLLESNYKVSFESQAQSVTLTVLQTSVGQWLEVHELVRIGSAEDGAWDAWGIDLTVVDDWNSQVSGMTTLMVPDYIEQMGFRIDATGYEYRESDCVVFGALADAMQDYGRYCDEI